MTVPFLDLTLQHAPLRHELLRAIGEVIDAGAFAGGTFVAGFEEEFASYCASPHAVGVGSGTEALWLSLLAMGVGPGDEVVTVPMSFVATAEAICFAGAKPVFVDIDEQTYTMDPVGLERAVTPRTKVIIPVHLFGQAADMDPILEVGRQHGVRVLEDAAQAHGAEYKGRKVGALGDAGCFSFYPGKNLGGLGEGGAVITADEELARKVRMLRNHGQSSKNRHSLVGWNSRLDGIQAAVLGIKLRQLDANNQRRRRLAQQYERGLADVPEVIRPTTSDDRRHVYHIYAIRVSERRRLIAALEAKGIVCGVHYPKSIHLQAAYRWLGYKRGDFPVAEQCAGEFVSLPLFPEMTARQVAYVVDAVKAAHGVCVTV